MDEAPPVAQHTADCVVTRREGLVSGIEIRPNAGGRIVADAFVDAPEWVADEKAGWAAGVCKYPVRRATGFEVARARPFQRLTGYSAAGARLRTWRAGAGHAAVQLSASSTNDGLSPNGRYLTVLRFPGAPGDDTGSAALPSVVRVAPPPRFVREGLRSSKDGMGGWVRHHPALEIAPNTGVEGAEPQVRLVMPDRKERKRRLAP